MILTDVNVLVYAFRRDAAHHRACRSWLTEVVQGDARFGMSPLALSAVVRLTTQARIYEQPSTLEEALGFCEYLLGQPHCEVVHPGERHWSIFMRLCREADIRGARATDAWYAALAIEHGCTWITCDRDFARFPGLQWQSPVR